MPLNPFARRSTPHLLLLGMTGVKMGERLVQIGCADGGRLAAVAAKVGLSGRAVAVLGDERSAERARKGAADEGVLVEIDVAPPDRLPLGNEEFDLAVVDDTDGSLGTLDTTRREVALQEIRRVLRPAGRVVIVGSSPSQGIGAMLKRPPAGPPFARSGEANSALEAAGFRAVRILGEREGLVFVEGLKPRPSSPPAAG